MSVELASKIAAKRIGNLEFAKATTDLKRNRFIRLLYHSFTPI